MSFDTAPIKALVSEKLFALVEVFGAANVGMMIGDATVNVDVRIFINLCHVASFVAGLDSFVYGQGRSSTR